MRICQIAVENFSCTLPYANPLARSRFSRLSNSGQAIPSISRTSGRIVRRDVNRLPGLSGSPQRSQLPNLLFVEQTLKIEIELVEALKNFGYANFRRERNSGLALFFDACRSSWPVWATQVCFAAAPYLRSLVDDGTEGLIRNRDNASPRFWMNASD